VAQDVEDFLELHAHLMHDLLQSAGIR